MAIETTEKSYAPPAKRLLPRAVRALIAATVVGGVACLAARIPAIGGWSAEQAAGFLALTLATAAGELFPVRLYQATETICFSLTDVAWLAALVLAPPSVVVVGVGAGVAIGQLAGRRAPLKVAFNAGQFLIALTAAEGVFQSLRGGSATDPATLGAAALAMAAAFAIYASGTALVVALMERRAFASVLLRSMLPDAMHWATNVAIGIVVVLLEATAPAALPLLVLPIAASYSAYGSWLEPLQFVPLPTERA